MRGIWRSVVTCGLLAAAVVSTTGSPAGAQQRFTGRSLPGPGNGRDYVCEVYLYPPGVFPTRGTFGSIHVLFYSGPNCTGNIVGDAQMFSQGATDENSSPTFLMTEAQLNTYALLLQRAAATNQIVAWLWCDDTKRSCLRAVGFRGQGTTP